MRDNKLKIQAKDSNPWPFLCSWGPPPFDELIFLLYTGFICEVFCFLKLYLNGGIYVKSY